MLPSSRFYSVQTGAGTKTENAPVVEGGEDDKLYKRLEIELRGHDPTVINSYVKFATTAAEHLNIDVGKRYKSQFCRPLFSSDWHFQ